MSDVPLGINAYKREAGLVPEVQCLNFYLEKDASGISPDGTLRIQRPGLTALYTLSSPCRALTVDPSNGNVLSVGAATFSVNGVTQGSVGTASFEQARIVVTKLVTAIYNSGEVYLWTSGSPVLLAMPGDAPGDPIDIDQLNGYIIILFATGRFYWLVPGETTVDALNFATAESSNDKALAVRQIGDEFWIFGARTVEPWQATGDFDMPFEAAVGRVIPHGCLSGITVCRYDNSIVWVDSDATVVIWRGGVEIISTPAIAERIRKRSLIISEHAVVPTGWTFDVDNHSFYVLYIPGQGSFVYDAATKDWFKWSRAGVTDWPWLGDSLQGKTYAGSLTSGKIWTVSPDVAGDEGVAFTRLLTGTIAFMGNSGRNDSISVGVGSSVDCTLKLRWRDGQDAYPDQYEEMECRAGFDVANMYRLGKPQQPYRELEVSFADLAFVRVAGCKANEAWQ